MAVNRHDEALRRLELVEDEDAAPDDGAPDQAGPDDPPAPRRRARHPRRRHLVLAVAGVAAVAGAFVVSSLGQGWSDRTALRDAAGGVTSLATAPGEQWRVATTSPQVWSVGDVLAVTDGEDLVGLSPADGTRTWTTALADTPRCGPAPGTTGRAGAGTLVCLTGPEHDPDAWVVDADGRVVARATLGDGLGRALVAREDAVLRWERAGGVVSVAVQDPTDGTVRWRATSGPDDIPMADVCRPQVAGTAAARVEHGLVVLEGCRVSAAFTLDGVRVDDPSEAVTVQVLPAPAGRFLRTTTASTSGTVLLTQLVDPDGAVERFLPGRPLVARSSDGTADPTRLLAVPSGLQAVDPRGNERWTLSGNVGQVLVVADGTAVLDRGYVVAAVDLASGQERWTWARHELGTRDTVVGAFTDGQVAALVVASPADPRTSRVVGLHLDDGSVAWDTRVEGDGSGFVALDGRLLRLDTVQGTLVGYG
ncbi:outer membrane protein assembly factor BamB family protein [Cellulosimicrobium marinum]|uniref:outer membrane protein assembly factor BamB family protein n=1 Tax=Cellulosimicrobium marinum TaxID=1638992 RepID=UPI001E2F0811|nr:PQQ-binding-like beta-propeller repeat protein [Cellulosimicrobium marinum]MCB7137529.1 PQQ-binding-like beta-propeller repeat protein [Cellulosimicrobium marinum]